MKKAAGPDGEVVDAGGGRWRVGTWRHSYADGGTHTFGAELHEVELLHPEQVEVAGSVFRPTRYHEKDAGDAIVIEMRVPLGDTDEAALRDLLGATDSTDQDRYLPVVRIGLEDWPRSMRFGQVLWHRRDGGVEARVVLVEESYDKGRPRLHGFAEPDLGHALTWAAATAAQVDALLGALRSTGVLDADTEATVRAAGDGALRRRLWDVREVSDLDDWD